MALTIYHNPRCSKSRKTLDIIQESGTTPIIVRYLEDRPSPATIIALAKALGQPVASLLRRGESTFKEATDLPDLGNDSALAEWIAANPIVLERPIVADSNTGTAVIGRPPENVKALLS